MLAPIADPASTAASLATGSASWAPGSRTMYTSLMASHGLQVPVVERHRYSSSMRIYVKPPRP
jgi:hypothetical protein